MFTHVCRFFYEKKIPSLKFGRTLLFYIWAKEWNDQVVLHAFFNRELEPADSTISFYISEIDLTGAQRK